MPLKLKLSADEIYNKEFTGSKSGYDCLQVDTMLDSVIADYEAMDGYVNKTDARVAELEKYNKILNDRVTKLETDNAILQKKLSDFTGPLPETNGDNLDLLKRVSKLEEALYKLGGDPTKIK